MLRTGLFRNVVRIAGLLLIACSQSLAQVAIDPLELPALEIEPPVVVVGQEPRYVAPTLRDKIGRIWAPVHINGKGPFRLVLDTGANSSAVIESVVTRLGIPQHPTKVQLHGVTGSATVPFIVAESLEIGDLYIRGAKLPVVADVFGGAEGVLGPNGLSEKRILIDFRNDYIEIASSRDRAATTGYTVVPIELTANNLLMLTVRVGGVKTKAVLDTGAQITLGNGSLRNALLRRKREGIEQDIVGITLDVQRGRSIEIPSLSLGDIEVRNMRITFGDVFIFDQWKLAERPAMLIGMDVIGSLDAVVIDYKREELHLKPRT